MPDLLSRTATSKLPRAAALTAAVARFVIAIGAYYLSSGLG
jgi:hypothetical protein